MNYATLQAKIFAGNAKAAQRIGPSYALYRPSGAAPVIASGNANGTTNASLTPKGSYDAPNTYGQATWQALMDGRLTQVGDYLVGDDGVFFIAAQQPLLPILAVSCNRTVSLTQGGSIVATGWPCSLLMAGGRGQDPAARLPGDPSAPHFQCLLPAVPGVLIGISDVMSDDLGLNYRINAAELTDLGWRLSVQQMTQVTDSIRQHYAAVIDAIGKLMTFRHVTKLGSALNPVEADVSVFTSTSAGAGSITLAVAGLGSWHLVAGDKFTIAGSPTVYTVTTGVVAASGKFANVAFSPALSADASAGAAVSWAWANDYPVKAMVGSYDAKLIDGSTISIRDQRVTVGPAATDGRVLPTPTNADKLNLGTGTGFRAIGIVQPQYVGEAVAAYEIQAKG